MPRRKSDPLLSALIAKLPQAGEDWAEDKQLSWLKLTAIAFGAIYGGDVASKLAGSASMPKMAKKATTQANGGHEFIIDATGTAKRANGERIMPADVVGSIYDQRGLTGDLNAIIWADGSKGIKGHQISVDSD